MQAPPAVLVVGRKRECALFFGEKKKKARRKEDGRLRRRSREGKESIPIRSISCSRRMMLVAVKIPHVFVREGGREEEGAILSNKLLLSRRSYTEITCTIVFSQAFADVNQRRDVSVILP